MIPPIHVAPELPKAFKSFDPSCTICAERERVELRSCELLLPSGMGLCNAAFMGLSGVSVGVHSSEVDTFATRNSGGGTYELIKVSTTVMRQQVDAYFGDGMNPSHYTSILRVSVSSVFPIFRGEVGLQSIKYLLLTLL